MSLDHLQPALHALDVYSTATGARMETERHVDVTGGKTSAAQCFSPTRSKPLSLTGHRNSLEVGPHPVLAASIRDVLGEVGAKGVSVASLKRGDPESETMQAALRSLYAAGATIDWETVLDPGTGTALPTYPWQNTSLWEETERAYRRRVQHDRHPMVSEVEPGPPRRFVADLSFGSLPFLEDHHVAGTVLFPGAGYVELALGGAREAGQYLFVIEDLELKVAVPLEAEAPARVAVTISPDSSVLSIHQEREGSDPVLCARAKVFSCGRVPDAVDIQALRQRLTDQLSPDMLYAALAKRGLRYGPSFQTVRSLCRTAGEVLAGLSLPEGVDAQGYHLHPVLLDGVFHSLIASVDDGPRGDLIPVSIDRIHYFGGSSPVVYSHGRIVRAGVEGMTGDLTLLAEDGAVVARSDPREFFLPVPAENSAIGGDQHQRRRTRAHGFLSSGAERALVVAIHRK